MAWHVDMTWHTLSGLFLRLTLPGHYWITLTIHAFKLALGKGLTAAYIPVPARRVLHGLYAVWWLAPTLSQARFLTDGKPQTGSSAPGGC